MTCSAFLIWGQSNNCPQLVFTLTPLILIFYSAIMILDQMPLILVKITYKPGASTLKPAIAYALQKKDRPEAGLY